MEQSRCVPPCVVDTVAPRYNLQARDKRTVKQSRLFATLQHNVPTKLSHTPNIVINDVAIVSTFPYRY